MKKAVIPYVPGTEPRWTLSEELEIKEFPWDDPWEKGAPGHAPEVTAKLQLTDAGLHVLMACDESSPRAVYTENNDPVCRDSCLEFFVNAAPEKGTDYINFECNANGALWSAFGPDRRHRQFLKDLGLKEPEVTVRKSAAGWSVEYRISQETLEALYGKALQPGDVFRANLYKCGDDTDVPHYMVWNHVEAAGPDYHRKRSIMSTL